MTNQVGMGGSSRICSKNCLHSVCMALDGCNCQGEITVLTSDHERQGGLEMRARRAWNTPQTLYSPLGGIAPEVCRQRNQDHRRRSTASTDVRPPESTQRGHLPFVIAGGNVYKHN